MMQHIVRLQRIFTDVFCIYFQQKWQNYLNRLPVFHSVSHQRNKKKAKRDSNVSRVVVVLTRQSISIYIREPQKVGESFRMSERNIFQDLPEYCHLD